MKNNSIMALKISLVGGLLIAIFILGFKLKDRQTKIIDLEQNINYITKENYAYKVKDSLNAFSIQQLNLTVKAYAEFIMLK